MKKSMLQSDVPVSDSARRVESCRLRARMSLSRRQAYGSVLLRHCPKGIDRAAFKPIVEIDCGRDGRSASQDYECAYSPQRYSEYRHMLLQATQN